MRKHNGMRPQDVAILLKIISINTDSWQLLTLSHSLKISISEISESLNRSRLAGLIDYHKKKINRQNLLEFLEHGVKYVFPQQPGPLVKGLPTAHSFPDFKNKFVSDLHFVWPDANGNIIGQLIEPFYQKQVEAVKEDQTFYKLLSLVEMLRVGKTREFNYAIKSLRNELLPEPPIKYHKN